MSCPVFEALANDAFHRTRGALTVIYAQLGTVAIAEIKFREIAVQMLFAAMLVNAVHARA